MPLFHSKVRLYLTADDRVVGEGDPHAHQLLVAAGGTLSFQQARKYGLVETTALPGPPETQHRAGPPATKARKGR